MANQSDLCQRIERQLRGGLSEIQVLTADDLLSEKKIENHWVEIHQALLSVDFSSTVFRGEFFVPKFEVKSKFGARQAPAIISSQIENGNFI